jgi:anti-anti-sigma factor
MGSEREKKNPSSPHVLHPAGFLDGVAGRALVDRIESLQQRDHRDVVIDCSGIDFLDSSGFGCLVRCMKVVNEYGQKFCLCGLNAQLRMLLDLSGMDGVVRVHASYQDALHYLHADDGPSH